MTKAALAVNITANRAEMVSTLTTLASALSATPDLPSQAQLDAATSDGDVATLVDYKIGVTLVRVLNALKIREDAS